MTPTDLQALRDSLHAARHKDATMSQWAREHGARLLDQCESLMAMCDNFGGITCSLASQRDACKSKLNDIEEIINGR